MEQFSRSYTNQSYIEKVLQTYLDTPSSKAQYDIKKIHNNSDQITQFNHLHLTTEHCTQASIEIFDYVTQYKTLLRHRLSINPDAIHIAGLFHHFFQYNNLSKPEKYIQKKSNDIREIHLLLYYYNELINSINTALKEIAFSKDEYETSTALHILEKIEEFFKKHSDLFPKYKYEFVILLFFDLYTILRHFASEKNLHDLDQRQRKILLAISRFTLESLPSITGKYGFGDRESEILDYAFYFTDPTSYMRVNEQVISGSPNPDWVNQVAKKLKKINNQFNIKPSLRKRNKGIYSSFKKADRENVKIQDLWDLVGFRIIIDSQFGDSCEEYLKIIEKEFKLWSNPTRRISNYVKKPKKNGYQSIHAIIEQEESNLIEIQIRTKIMDFIAEYGSASHLEYKGVSASGLDGKRRLESVLKENELDLNDFVKYIGQSLSRGLPIWHYYELIGNDTYDLDELIKDVKFKKIEHAKNILIKFLKTHSITLDNFIKRYQELNNLEESEEPIYTELINADDELLLTEKSYKKNPKSIVRSIKRIKHGKKIIDNLLKEHNLSEEVFNSYFENTYKGIERNDYLENLAEFPEDKSYLEDWIKNQASEESLVSRLLAKNTKILKIKKIEKGKITVRKILSSISVSFDAFERVYKNAKNKSLDEFFFDIENNKYSENVLLSMIKEILNK